MPETTFSNFRWGFSGEIQHLVCSADGKVLHRAAGPANGIDLGGKWLSPAFNDAHCHILPGGLDLTKLNLSVATSKEEVQDLVRDHLPKVQPGVWLHAVHYDQTKFADKQHITRNELDAISTTTPILLRLSNGHASVANSACLTAAVIDESASNPAGGEFGRDAAGRLNGLLTEEAHELVGKRAPKPDLEQMVQGILAAGERMSSMGILAAADMMTGRFDQLQELAAYQEAARRGNPLRIHLYIQWAELFGPRKVDPEILATAIKNLDPDRVQIGGAKIFADGAIGSATAAIYGSYTGREASGAILSRHAKDASSFATQTVSGQLIYSPEKLNEMVRIADQAGYRIAIHTIGDYATDLVMDAYSQTDDPTRHRIEHAMILSDAQIDRMAKLGCHLTMQPEFMKRFGHAYEAQLGPDRRSKLVRLRSVLDAGIETSLNSDFPIVPGNPLDGIETASNRPSGYDPLENCTREEAMLGYTGLGAKANRDASLGSLDAGQWADFVVFDEDPRLGSTVSKVFQGPNELPVVCR